MGNSSYHYCCQSPVVPGDSLLPSTPFSFLRRKFHQESTECVWTLEWILKNKSVIKSRSEKNIPLQRWKINWSFNDETKNLGELSPKNTREIRLNEALLSARLSLWRQSERQRWTAQQLFQQQFWIRSWHSWVERRHFLSGRLLPMLSANLWVPVVVKVRTEL